MRERIANLASNILNPLFISLGLIILLSFESTSSALDAVKWSLISIAAAILPVLLAIIYLVRKKRLESPLIITRLQRTRLYLVAGVGTGIGCVILSSLGAPQMLIAAFVAGVVAIIIFMGINLWWKISLHAAFITASAAILVILYGAIAAVAAVLVALTAWSRVELKYHSLAQVAAGGLLTALIVVVVFCLFGLVVWW